ncbi:hypothetical protein AJ79_06175 [Helicocarpus griseus UAMH5409]|uniref:glucose oxidase n=1 Tax=Helicocarpus griseus UAMH5409 TaxID=1447875 RepID=A0A2B7XGK7_9EURO|nr:hypothetical protein AJ79_06175 [Helicocarpus griseus UAMH5409]
MKFTAFLVGCGLAASARAIVEDAIDLFDFVVIGGGTCGLAVAARLSEIENISIAIIEAGNDERNNANVTDPSLFTVAFGTPIDWTYKSVAQPHLGNRQLDYHSGKAWGGSSAINGMTYIRADAVQIDAWERIGNKGWNWDNLYPYYKRIEQFSPPTPEQSAVGASYIEELHGENGPVHVGYPFFLTNSSLFDIAYKTWQKLGIPYNQDPNGGSLRGFSAWPQTLDREANIRSDSATAYFHPVQDRPNLKIFNGVARRITWDDEANTGSGSNLVARGVEFITNEGVKQIIHAKREVILSAGSLRSPAILELSGVGNPDILSKHGISTTRALSAVGENLQDQPQTSIFYQNSQVINGSAPYVAYADAWDIFGESTSNIAAATKEKLSEWAGIISKSNNNAVSPDSIQHVFQIQHELIFRQNVSVSGTLTTASGDQLTSVFWGLLPFSRGSVHISSEDPLEHPLIDPNFYLIDWDLRPMVELCKLARKYWSTEPAGALAVGELVPTLETVPDDATDEQWVDWLKLASISNMHPAGTLAMMPEELGGVVDHTLTVYGTRNVRVVDASVMPFQVGGHLTSTLYAITERTVDIIRDGIAVHASMDGGLPLEN